MRCSKFAVIGSTLAWLLLAGCDGSNPAAPDPLVDVPGMVMDAAGVPLAGVLVEVTSGPGKGVTAVTGMDGRFLLPGAGAAIGLSLRFTRDGFATGSASYAIRPAFVSYTLWPSGAGRLRDGDYSVTLTADPECATLPTAVRTRTYTGLMSRPDPSLNSFSIALGGAEFYPTQRMFSGSSRANDFAFTVYSLEADMRWGDALPLVERIDQQASLAFFGKSSGTLPADLANGITADLAGTLSYCPQEAKIGLWFVCAATPVECESTHHRLTLVPK